MSDENTITKLSIEIDADNSTVFAVILASEENSEYSKQLLIQQLDKSGLSGLSLSKTADKDIAKLFNENRSGKVKIGVIRDAKIEVVVSSDLLSAILKITTACAGKHVATNEIVTAIDEQGIDHQLVNKKRVVGLLRKAQRVEPGSVIDVVIAKGRAPIHGKDTQFECLIEEGGDRKPNQRDDGTLDYYDLGEILSIDEGCELMRKHPPILGKSGRTVTGTEIVARVAKKLNFKKCKGAIVSLSDKDLLVAAIKGQPVIAERSVSVDKVLTVKNVDLHTGHIDFDGSVVVKGDVVSGMKIKVTGDVQVFGMVENASIEAVGNIDLKLGAMGHADMPVADNTMVINCLGNLTAAYLESVQVDVQGDILIKSRVSNCEINAGHQIIVGNHQQQKSGIVGGHVNAGSVIRAEVLGSSGCTLTHVAIVCKAEFIEQFEDIKKEITEHDEILIKKLGVMVGLSKKHTEESKQQLHTLKLETEAMKVTINDLIKQKIEIELLMATAGAGKISVQKEAYPGVNIKILDQEQEIKSKYGVGSFLLIDGVMTHNSSVT
ncbi:MAG: FapA family protein [Methylococcales bacterium]